MTVSRAFTRRQFLLGTAGALAVSFAPSTPMVRIAGAVVDFYTVVTGPLNLRIGPGLKYSVIATLPAGTRMEIIDSGGTADGYTWVKVWVGSLNTTGYVAREFIAKAPLPDGNAFPVGSTVLTTAAVNLRRGAGLGYAVIVTLWQGASLTITGAPVAADGYTWYPVRTGYGTEGWVAGSFLKAGAPAPSVFPVGSTVKTTARVNLRSGAGFRYSVIVVLWAGAPLTVTGAPVAADGYTWYPVRTGYGTTGWVAGAYLVA